MAGRPVKFETVEEMENRIADYFATITITYPVFNVVADGVDGEKKEIFKRVPRLNNAGKQVMQTDYLERPTVLGMCRHLDITRETLCQYEKQEGFSDTIKRAKARIEEYLETQLYRKDQVTGIIFNLKNNFGWKDTQAHEVFGKDGGAVKFDMEVQRLDDNELLDAIEAATNEIKALQGGITKTD